MGLKLIVWSHVVAQFALRSCGVASASAAVVKCRQWARVWVQLQFTRQKRREIFCHFEGKVITWLMLDWRLPRKNWWLDLLGPNSTSTLWVLSKIPKPSLTSENFCQVADWLEGMEKKIVGRVFQSIKRRHACQVTHSSPKNNVLFYTNFWGINLAI